jgi:hypothetical protein
MQEPLAIYLHDHLAGAVVAIELLEVMRKRKDPLGSFANHLLNEVEVDRTTLMELANKVGSGETSSRRQPAGRARRSLG